MSLQTLNEIFFAVVERDDRVVVMHRRAIQWVSISSAEFYQNVVGVARALREWGISPGDRVAISEREPSGVDHCGFRLPAHRRCGRACLHDFDEGTDGIHFAGFGSAGGFCLH